MVSREIENYSEKHSSPPSDLLQKIDRETNLEVLYARMLSGHLQGHLLQHYAQMLQPKRILEIGTFTGYSAICLAQGLAEDGILYTLEANEELESRIRKYISEANLEDKIKLIIGQALDTISALNEVFDLVFIDADKENYSNYYDAVFDKIRSGGVIIADNVLWYGKVVDEKEKDKDTVAIRQFNKKVTADERVMNYMLPVRDGLMVIVKK